jgi:hypothetical protein
MRIIRLKNKRPFGIWALVLRIQIEDGWHPLNSPIKQASATGA